MVTYNIRVFAFTILGLAFFTYGIIFLSTQNLDSIDFNNALTHISTTISINVILWTLFIKWAWKWKMFYPWLVPFPNLSGEWEGELKSNWKEKSLDPIPTEIKISQTFFNVQVKIKTNESRSHSIGASFDIDKDRGLEQLIYSYINTPKSSVRERSEIHYGSTILVFEDFKVNEMEGQYWTDRETTGEIKLKRKNVA
ncbi:hypothetical protein [uncultured Cyclobacterium sp.]|mgnify:FL=1|uniref:Cap15 family cyclic dinucleotide receptor domain-containing protein n=1 Tax=uncultured Cyclobacterium sp. TaxID=453820 RepID=UPI0030EC84AF|tara:strand:- start:298485 stop:299075 length:591 start_codon:yes stop_codon:yes gene_type:complete